MTRHACDGKNPEDKRIGYSDREVNGSAAMEHPMFIRRIHKFFNPVREGALRDAEERVEKLRAGGVTEPHFETEVERLRHPNDVKLWQVYFMIGGVAVVVVVAVLFVILR